MSSSIKKKKSCHDFVKSLDIFGTTVDFSFQNSQRFGTRGGLIISVITIVFMLLYSILIILDSVKFSKPFILTSYTNLVEEDILNMTTNFPSSLTQTNNKTISKQILNLNKNDLSFKNPSKIKQQISFALFNIDTNHFIPYDPTYFVINGIIIDKEKGSALLAHTELCKDNFAYASNQTFAYLQLGKSYCFHSDFSFRDTYPSMYSKFRGFKLKVKRCVNNTYSYVQKENAPAYRRLKAAFGAAAAKAPPQDFEAAGAEGIFDIPTRIFRRLFFNMRKSSNRKNSNEQAESRNEKNTLVDEKLVEIENNSDFNFKEYVKSKIDSESDSDSKKNNKHKNKKKIKNRENKHISERTMNSYTDASFSTIDTNILHNQIASSLGVAQNPLVCQPTEKIEAQIANIKLLLFYNNFLLNSTQEINTVIPKIDNKECYLSKSLSKEKLLYFSYIIVKTQNSLIPQSLSDRPDLNYFLSLESEKIVYGDANVISSNSTQSAYIPEIFEDLDNSNENLFSVLFALYNYKKEITRRYRDIFEIMGNIGGLSKILMLIGFCVVFYYAGLRKKEALMNELYTNKSSLSLKGFQSKLKCKLELVELFVIKNVFASCDKRFKENDGEQMQKRYAAESRNVLQAQVDFEAENKNTNNNDENEEFVLEAKDAVTAEVMEADAKSVNALFKRIYLEFCDEQNSEAKLIWATPERNREWEFYNRVFCRAFVKFYFTNLAEQFGFASASKYPFNTENNNLNLNNNNNKNLESNNADSVPASVPRRDLLADIRNHLANDFGSNLPQQKSFKASMANYINDVEAANYQSLAENIDTESAAKFRFEIWEIFCLVCCRSCSTTKFKARCKEFESKYEEFLQQTDFKEIINSLQEFKTFKKTFFEKGQLWLFDSCPIKAITYEDYEDENAAGGSGLKDKETQKALQKEIGN